MSSDINEEVNHRKRRRNRMRVSCLNCYASKRKCDRKRPCTRCVQHGLTGLCVYELDDPDTRDPTLDETTHLRNRIAELESVIREINNRPHPRWFAANGVEHIPELVATRRPSVSNNSTGTGTVSTPSQAQKTRQTPSRCGARNNTTPNDNDTKVGSKRKHEETIKSATFSLASARFKRSRHVDVESEDDDDNEDMSVVEREAYGSDNSYCTDEDDGDDDEDYEEYKSRSRPKSRLRHVPAKQAPTLANAYSRGNDAKPTHSLSHGTSSNTIPKTAGTISSQHSTSTSIARSISISSSNPPSASFSPAPPEFSMQLGPQQSALGLTFDAPLTDSEYKVDADDDSSCSPLKSYSLRADVEWTDQKEDHNIGSRTGSFASSASSFRSKSLANDSSQLEVKPNTSEDSSVVRHGRYIDIGVQTIGDKSAAYTTAQCSQTCSCLSEAEVRNEVTFLITILGDISNVLKAAHRGVHQSRERQSTVITHRCELLRRVVELDEYFSNLSNERISKTIGLSTLIDNIKGSPRLIPGDLPSSNGQSNPSKQSSGTSSHSKTTSNSKLSKSTHRQLPGSDHQSRKRRSRTWSSESRNSTAPSDTAVETTYVPVPAPAPTPASILARSLSQSSSPSDRAAPAPASQTDTLASVLADTLMNTGTPNTKTKTKARSGDSGVLTISETTRLKAGDTPPSRFLQVRTPDPPPPPTIKIPSTPTFSPSSPLLRPTNSAMRRPDADLLPLYSYAAAGQGHPECGGENHDIVERGHCNAGGTNTSTTAHHSHSHSHHHNHHHHLQHHSHSKITLGLEHQTHTVAHAASPPPQASPAASVTDNHHHAQTLDDGLSLSVGVESVSSSLGGGSGADTSITMNVDNVSNMGMDLDVDAEGEPAPESGYQYAYFEDGYRYEYVCIDDV